MLVLSRRSGEQIRISHTIEVTVLAIQGNKVKLGLVGPPDVLFQREELCRRSPGREVRETTVQRRPVLEAVCR